MSIYEGQGPKERRLSALIACGVVCRPLKWPALPGFGAAPGTSIPIFLTWCPDLAR